MHMPSTHICKYVPTSAHAHICVCPRIWVRRTTYLHASESARMRGRTRGRTCALCACRCLNQLCACVCTSVCMCMPVCMCTRMRAHVKHESMHICTRSAHICAHICAHMCTHMRACARAHSDSHDGRNIVSHTILVLGLKLSLPGVPLRLPQYSEFAPLLPTAHALQV